MAQKHKQEILQKPVVKLEKQESLKNVNKFVSKIHEPSVPIAEKPSSKYKSTILTGNDDGDFDE